MDISIIIPKISKESVLDMFLVREDKEEILNIV